jgi:hypothetical protein
VTASVALVLVAAWTLTTSASYSLMSHFIHMRPVTRVSTTRPEVGLLVDAPARDIPALAAVLRRDHVAASFAMSQPPTSAELNVVRQGDQAIPRLGGGGWFRWLETGDQLHRLDRPLGSRPHPFIYASSGPSLGQWLLAHHAGGKLVAGAVRLRSVQDRVGPLQTGEVIEISSQSTNGVLSILRHLCPELRQQHLRAVSLGRLLQDAGVSV